MAMMVAAFQPLRNAQGFIRCPFSMSQTSLPAFIIGLNAISAVLDKAEAFAKAKKINSTVLTAWRLAPDMFALARQVQVATDQAKNSSARLAESRRRASRTMKPQSSENSRRAWPRLSRS